MLTVRSWQDESFRKLLIDDSRSAIQKEFGIKLPKDMSVKVIDADPKKFYFVLPAKPSDELDDSELEKIAGGGVLEDFGNMFVNSYNFIVSTAMGIVSGKW